MAFTVKDFQDLVRLLEQHEEWRRQLRRLLLTEEFLELPDRLERTRKQTAEQSRRLERALAALSEAQARTEAALSRLAEAQGRTEERLARLEEVVARLAEAQVQMAERVARLEEAQIRMEERLARLEEAQIQTEERLARLEEVVARLAEAQVQMAERVARLEEAQIRTEERLARLEEVVARLAEAQVQMAERVARLEEAQIRTEERVARLEEAQIRTEKRMDDHVRRVEDRLNAFGAVVGRTAEGRMAIYMERWLQQQGFQVLDPIAALPLGSEGEIDGVTRVQDASGQVRWVLISCKLHVTSQHLENFDGNLRRKRVREFLRAFGISGKALAFIFGLTLDINVLRMGKRFPLGLVLEERGQIFAASEIDLEEPAEGS